MRPMTLAIFVTVATTTTACIDTVPADSFWPLLKIDEDDGDPVDIDDDDGEPICDATVTIATGDDEGTPIPAVTGCRYEVPAELSSPQTVRVTKAGYVDKDVPITSRGTGANDQPIQIVLSPL
ncbi:MAG TPA: hypothetical protein VGF99_15660 [Myxococcota bacterium]